MRSDGFFAGVRTGIESGDRVDRQQQSKQEHAEHARVHGPNATTEIAGVVGERPEPREVTGWCVVEQGQGQDDSDREDQVAGEIGQHRGQFDAEVIDHGLQNRDRGNEDDLCYVTGITSEGSGCEEECTDIDCAQDRDQTK